MKRSKKEPVENAAPGPFHNPFALLKERLGSLPPGSTAPAPEVKSVGPEKKGPARAVVRIERTGRGGKEVTVVEHLELSLKEREKWCKALKGALGCGGAVEGDNLVLQGDHRERLEALLQARGVRKVVIA